MISKEQFDRWQPFVLAAKNSALEFERQFEIEVFGREIFEAWLAINLEYETKTACESIHAWILRAKELIHEAVDAGIDPEWLSHTGLSLNLRQAKRMWVVDKYHPTFDEPVDSQE